MLMCDSVLSFLFDPKYHKFQFFLPRISGGSLTMLKKLLASINILVNSRLHLKFKLDFCPAFIKLELELYVNFCLHFCSFLKDSNWLNYSLLAMILAPQLFN